MTLHWRQSQRERPTPRERSAAPVVRRASAEWGGGKKNAPRILFSAAAYGVERLCVAESTKSPFGSMRGAGKTDRFFDPPWGPPPKIGPPRGAPPPGAPPGGRPPPARPLLRTRFFGGSEIFFLGPLSGGRFQKCPKLDPPPGGGPPPPRGGPPGAPRGPPPGGPPRGPPQNRGDPPILGGSPPKSRATPDFGRKILKNDRVYPRF